MFWAYLNTGRPLSHKHMQILTSEPHCRGGDGTFIVRALPEKAISGKMKWERWSERTISIFYEHFPRLPLGFLWLSASNRIPSSLIPFSKSVIRKSPLDISIAPLSSCVGSAVQSLHHRDPQFLSHLLQSVSPLFVVLLVLWEATSGLCCPFVLQVITHM